MKSIFPWINSRSSSSSSGAPEAGDVPLENMSRQSTSSQDLPPPPPDHGQRIIQELLSGNYTCTICLDPVTPGSTYERSLWHCRHCHQINHFRCAKSWFEASVRGSLPSIFGPRSWKCPSCALECSEPKARCWCGKHGFGTLDDPAGDRPNACRDICENMGKCVHGIQQICRKRCHPGRCEIPCEPACANEPVIPRDPGRWERVCGRLAQRRTGQGRRLLFSVAFIVTIYIILAVLCAYHIKIWSKPYRYTDWRQHEGKGFAEWFAVLLCGLMFVMPGLIMLLLDILEQVTNLLVLAFSLRSSEAKWSVKLLVSVVCVGIWILPIIGFLGGPKIAWYHQMKDTCNGLDTRIAMHKEGHFEVKSLSRNIPSYDMYLGSHLKPVLEGGIGNISAIHPFETYQRLSISRPSLTSNIETEHIAIDIDIPHHLYRILHLNVTDLENAYLASGYKQKSSLRTIPTFHPVEERIVSNGSFSGITETRKHMLIPELEVGIAGMYGFAMDYEQEPFVKVYQNRAPSSSSSFQDTLAMPWDSKKKANDEHELVMRTASFGHGRQRLDVCVKEGRDQTRWKEAIGVKEELWVPFAVLAAYRQRMEEVNWGSRKSRSMTYRD